MRDYRRLLIGLGWLIAAGTCFQISSCSSLGSYIANINPCGTVLNCDPVTYRFIQSNYQGPGANPSVDPSCTYPPFCANDPFVRTTATK